jgi:hypothetical protein
MVQILKPLITEHSLLIIPNPKPRNILDNSTTDCVKELRSGSDMNHGLPDRRRILFQLRKVV